MFNSSHQHPEAKAWAALSQTLGKDILLTQASGGNTSVKLDDQKMLVKASGLRLGEVTQEKGWVGADFKRIRQGVPELRNEIGTEAQSKAYQRLLASSTDTSGLPISLEAGLHALMPDRWVAHVHSVAGQLLGLMPVEEARKWVAENSGGTVSLHHVAPAVPGHDLCVKVAEGIANDPPPTQGNGIPLWILQNHGVAWGATTDKNILAASEKFEGPLRERFGFHRFSPPRIEPLDPNRHPGPEGKIWYRAHLSEWPICHFDTTPVLTDFVGHFDLWSDAPPDFIQTDDHTANILAQSPREMEGHAQVFYAHALVSTLARQEGWFRPLPPHVVQAIKRLELERSHP
ncbi:MAG: class II aldolase/adducin family protein [Elusimicrobia bacterium]|jgi:ribulose-5-phosphate 4-epimerase/fuculose-1-phosphate aldolase|nr:class II aldolase/adducin family protein [Elusimicrobiota bacterium]